MSALTRQGIIVWGSVLVYRLLSGLGWYGNGRVAVGDSDEQEGNRRNGIGNCALLPTTRCSQGAWSGPGRHIP